MELLRANFAPMKPDWRLFAEIFQDKQRVLEATDSFICRKRKIFAQLSEKISENAMLNMLYSQLLIKIRERIPRENIKNIQNLLEKAREVELLNKEISPNEYSQSIEEVIETPKERCNFCRKKNHVAENCYKKLEAERKSKTKAPETTVTCYGCQKPGITDQTAPTATTSLSKVLRS